MNETMTGIEKFYDALMEIPALYSLDLFLAIIRLSAGH
tara:strand:- start:3640 stop:3753 length:114 start_codon:yes stop_codon:yes gene_type:complete